MAPRDDDEQPPEFDPEKLQHDEQFVREGLVDKVRRTLRLVPFIEDALAAYYCAVDPITPGWVKGILFGALAYFILPSDVIPDFLAGLGYTDDASVLLAALKAVHMNITDSHRERARQFLDKDQDI
jgi:uncharacterized membrane protein YkvA (DUF1232 family)